MKTTIRIISLILCICLLFSACSNGAKEENPSQPTDEAIENSDVSEEKNGDGKITLPYNKTDGLNPFFSKSYENLYIAMLLFDSLYSVDDEYNTIGVIAESISVTDKVATVRLHHGITCRGSSEINADDVVYSFNMAKASYGWKNGLKGVVSAQAVGQYAVDFMLEYKDIYVAGKLNFPIAKVGTADVQTAVPTGSGDYYYSNNKLISIVNQEKQIYLSPIGTRDSAENALNIGVTDVFFSDLSNCDYTVAAGKITDVLLNNMVYLGLNSSRGALNNYIRNAIAAKLDGDKIALSSYQGHATPSKLPVNPASSLADEITQIDTIGNADLAENIIDRCGYTRYSGRAKTNGAYTLSLSLIVNKDNRFRVAAAYHIADSLAECGFLITVQTISFMEYTQRIESGNYDMYVGEIKLDNSMDIAEFFKEESPFSAGIDKEERAATEYFKYRAGELTPAEYYDIFAEYYPIVPIVFRKGYAVTSGEVNLKFKQMPYSLYGGI